MTTEALPENVEQVVLQGLDSRYIGFAPLLHPTTHTTRGGDPGPRGGRLAGPNWTQSSEE
jgi:hypothetical protein